MSYVDSCNITGRLGDLNGIFREIYYWIDFGL